ncbi:hypothetical protein K432DRAFT_445621 [Lepidopterella palustris CBS 459.81]|uniref:Zn(2)-C6 fungal-type domain-containing protein n=1 Tax=Lepidopterella palustris CBS 459.81 TaxID=1314670 RepID=A0A8E2E444_9PEZI|nr:hypothetical protein K432DRAFT_445621 [Lepidopterella palustris CBS 459.81]
MNSMEPPRLPHGTRRRYVSRACLNCRVRKVKCSEERPCERCRTADETCEYVASRRGYRRHSKSLGVEIQPQTSTTPSQPSQTTPREVSRLPPTPEQSQPPSAGLQYLSPRDPQLFQEPTHLSVLEPYASPSGPDMPAREAQLTTRDNPVSVSDSQLTFSGSHMSDIDPLLCLSRAASMSTPYDTNRPEIQRLASMLQEMGERLSAVEREQLLLKRKLFSAQPSQNTPATDGTILSPSGESEAGNTLEANAEIELHTSLSRTIDVLDGTLRTKPSPNGTTHSRRPSENHTSLGDYEVLSPCGSKTIVSSPESNPKLQNVPSLRRAIDLWFSYINPNLPFINENQFRAQFENHLITGGNESDGRSKDIFVVLANLIYAEAMLLSEKSPAASPIPGWSEFCYADRILSRLSWLSRGNIQIIQCLIIKSRYLSTIQRIRSSYDTMSKVVQICFYIGLHNQPRWGSLSPFEIAMRQRVFWCVFYMDRGIALAAGLPYLLRQSDFNVDFPRATDDKQLFPNRPLPEETPSTSYIPYLASLVNWAKLCTNMWDAMFSANAPKPAGEELITALDTEILYSICQLPPSLQWDPAAFVKNNHAHDFPQYVRRQMCLSHLHTNHLRLVMRHKTLVTLTCSRKLATESVWIATSSIDAIASYRASTSNIPNSMFRFSAVMYLTAAIIPLICAIVQESSTNPHTAVRDEVVRAFDKALNIMRDIAPGFGIAQLMLNRLDPAVGVARQMIERRKTDERMSEVDNAAAEGMGIDAGQNLLELFREFEKPRDEVSGNQETLFWGDGFAAGLGSGDAGPGVGGAAVTTTAGFDSMDLNAAWNSGDDHSRGVANWYTHPCAYLLYGLLTVRKLSRWTSKRPPPL